MRREPIVFALRRRQRTAAGTILKASRTRGGGNGRLLDSSEPGERSSLAPASMLEGSAVINPRASPSLPACVASADPLPNAAERAPDCSLHRRVSSINGAIRRAKTAGILPATAGSELAGGDAAAGGLADLHGGPIDEGCRGLCRGGGGGGCNRRSGRGAGGEGRGGRRTRPSACPVGTVNQGGAEVAHGRREGDPPRTPLRPIQRQRANSRLAEIVTGSRVCRRPVPG
jgi:hypothetical protein